MSYRFIDKFLFVVALLAIAVLTTLANIGIQRQQQDAINTGSLGTVYQSHTGILPDPTLTPGATNPAVTPDNISKNICNAAWHTGTIRPSVSYTNKLKVQQIAQYGYTDTNPADYEEDHLISLVLGGSPTDPKNLWPQSYKTVPNAKNKDAVEVWLHSQVCKGAITLQEAQKEISGNWVEVYNKISPSGSLGGTQVVQADDNDDK